MRVFEWFFGICGPKPFHNRTRMSGFQMVWVQRCQNAIRNLDMQCVRYSDESGIRVSGFRMVTVE